MKKTKLIVMALAMITISGVTGCDAQQSQAPPSQEKQLQDEKDCSKQAHIVFEDFKYRNRNEPMMNSAATPLSYECHYSRKHNKCFVFFTWAMTDSELQQELFDAYENKEFGGCYGSYADPGLCFGNWDGNQEKSVKGQNEFHLSRDEFKKFVKEYMED
jgi:hypothetical protein